MDNPAEFVPDLVRPGISTTGVDRNWPNNTWWVAAHGTEITSKPTMRWILELPIALYRTEEGTPVALHNRCPHRGAPLHLGEVTGDNLACPYHGIQFGRLGQCVKVPTQDSVPSAIRVRSFPVAERYGFIWIWTGEPSHADLNLIPDDLAFLADGSWHNVWGYKAVNGNYMQMKENVLDLTHFAFLHKNSLGITDWNRPPDVESSESRVTYRQRFENAPLAPVYAHPAGKAVGKPVTRETWGTQVSPAVNIGAVDMFDSLPEENGLAEFKLRVVHLTTPVSIGKTHYYWALARDHGAPFDYERERAMADVVFGEDIAIVEQTQAMARSAIDQDDSIEFSVAADRAAVIGRRIVRSMIQKERDNHS